MRGIFLDAGSIGTSDVDFSPLQRVLKPLALPDQTLPEEIVRQAENTDVVITNKNLLTESVLARLPALRLIVVAATGVDNIDLKAAEKFNICVCNCRGYATASVAQHTLMLILNLVTGYPASGRRARTQWSQGLHFCQLGESIAELPELCLGLVGFGTLGRAVGKFARAIGMQVLIAERSGRQPRPGRLPLAEVLEAGRYLVTSLPTECNNQRTHQPQDTGTNEVERIFDQHRTRRSGGRRRSDSGAAKRYDCRRRTGRS